MKIAALFLLLGLSFAAEGSRNPEISVGIESSWETPEFASELIEATFLLIPSAVPAISQVLFPLISADQRQHATPSELYSAALATIAEYATETDVMLWEMHMALHASSPRVIAAYQVYNSSFSAIAPPGCLSWVLVGKLRTCELAEIENAIKNPGSKPKTTKIVTAIPMRLSESGLTDTITLFVDVHDKKLTSLTNSLSQFSSGFQIHWISTLVSEIPGKKQLLRGWGVGLNVKKGDYIVQDDRILSTAASSGLDLSFSEIEEHPDFIPESWNNDDDDDIETNLTDEQIARFPQTLLSMLSYPKPFELFSHYLENVPYYKKRLNRLLADPVESLMEEIHGNSRYISAGSNLLWLNNKPIQSSDFSAWGILKEMKQENNLLKQMESAGLSTTMSKLLLQSMEPKKKVDMYHTLEFGEAEVGAVIFLNDLEVDPEYQVRPWRNQLAELLRPMHPNSLPQVARNCFTAIFSIDLSTAVGRNFLLTAHDLKMRGLPIRWGIVPFQNEHGRLWRNAVDGAGLDLAMQWIQRLDSDSKDSFEIIWNDVFEENAANMKYERMTNMPARTELAAIAYKERLALESEGNELFMNGLIVSMKSGGHPQEYLQNLQRLLASSLRTLQEAVYLGTFDPETCDIAKWWMEGDHVSQSRSKLTQAPSSRVSTRDLLSNWNDQQGWLTSASSEPKSCSLILIGDFENSKNLLIELLGWIKTNGRSKLLLIPYSNDIGPITEMVYSSLNKKNSLKDIDEMLHYLDAEFVSNKQQLSTSEEEKYLFLKAAEATANNLQMTKSETILVVNGRVIKIDGLGAIKQRDISTIVTTEYIQYIAQVERFVSAHFEEGLSSDIVSSLSSIVACLDVTDANDIMSDGPSERNSVFESLQGNLTKIELGDTHNARFHFTALIDPFTEESQVVFGLLKTLSSVENTAISLRIHITPSSSSSIGRFYKYLWPSKLAFDDQGNEVFAKVTFKKAQVLELYTLAPDIPESWILAPKLSNTDLDNICFQNLQQENIFALFYLKNIILSGHARESHTQSNPPRGLQLLLSSSKGQAASEALVVANLGYLQFRTNPGLWHLSIRDGRGRDVFELESSGADGWFSKNDSQTEIPGILLDSFNGVTIFPRFRRRNGQFHEDVLEEPTFGSVPSLNSLAGSLWSIFWRKETTEIKPSKSPADINIFTVASGLLYERFASIMILSVLNHTNSTVKFWFIENFLSPSFIDFLPSFSRQYNFDYELVTYKWPTWLRAQRDKQRTIWGYKILFLDVLFPLSLDKIIFVDADQIVRTDMMDLVNENLNGAPYGYAPMGMDKEEMNGFRFWTTGYWRDHLRGRPYHISALYVVDLKRFRQLAAGDRLRGQYQALSSDPGSLANLDQDLPNNMQHDVPIVSSIDYHNIMSSSDSNSKHTLDQSWLWCETWCSMESLSKAKTIDLCQNPLTKQPKLERARMIPEWEVYDNEIAEFASNLRKVETTNSEIEPDPMTTRDEL